MDSNLDYAIAITTFEKRFEKYLKPLIYSIRKQKPVTPIWIAVNGENKQPFSEEYRKNLLRFCAKVDYVYLFMHEEFRSLSKLWNNLVISNSKNYTLLLNDDVVIHDRFFEKLDNVHYNRPQSLGTLSYTIRESQEDPDDIISAYDFSHFMVNIEELMRLNWFDERYISIGREDLDFSMHYQKQFNKMIDCVQIEGIYNESPTQNRLQNTNLDSTSKYSQVNKDFFDLKYATTNFNIRNEKEHFEVEKVIDDYSQYPYEMFFRENKDRI